MALLTLFLLRSCFGLALGMLLVSSRQVTSGYFRNNLYVVLGLAALAVLLSRSAVPEAYWYAMAAAALSYSGAVAWLYERPGLGKAALAIVGFAAFAGSLAVCESRRDAAVPTDTPSQEAAPEGAATDSASWGTAGRYAPPLRIVGNATSGLLIGLTLAAMLLGHWYLNSPTMQLAPLGRLIMAMAVAVLVQAVVSALGLWGELAVPPSPGARWLLFLTLRWAFGIVGVAGLLWMAWQTLKIPNTQSATGILYVALVGVFVGETMSLLLSAESVYPV